MVNLLKFWFTHEDYWFANDSIKDQYICDHFGNLLSTIKQPTKLTDYLHYIILYDQITRHMDRVRSTTFADQYHTIALQYTEYLIPMLHIFTPAEICFILLPLRHDSNIELNIKALHIIIKLRAEIENSYYRRFYYATVKSIAHKQTPIKLPILSTTESITKPLVNIENELISFDILPIKQNQSKNIIVSLSGGVDSMICAYILKSIGYTVTAVHINYNNRECCQKEVSFIHNWCSSMNIELYVRTITEIHRNNKRDRVFYEEITKSIRFNSYKYVSDRINNGIDGSISVILGHNKDDCLENIITNIKKQRGYDNLFGMNHTSVQNGITLIRPMLNIRKSDIIRFANKYSIPYLPDSTPEWSDRGKIRDRLVPYVNTFDSDIMLGLVKMSETYKEMATTYYRLLNENTHIESTRDGISIRYQLCYDIAYWNMIFNTCRQQFDIPVPSNKSIRNTVQLLKKNTVYKIILSPRYTLHVLPENKALITKSQ